MNDLCKMESPYVIIDVTCKTQHNTIEIFEKPWVNNSVANAKSRSAPSLLYISVTYSKQYSIYHSFKKTHRVVQFLTYKTYVVLQLYQKNVFSIQFHWGLQNTLMNAESCLPFLKQTRGKNILSIFIFGHHFIYFN